MNNMKSDDIDTKYTELCTMLGDTQFKQAMLAAKAKEYLDQMSELSKLKEKIQSDKSKKG